MKEYPYKFLAITGTPLAVLPQYCPLRKHANGYNDQVKAGPIH